MDVIRFSDRRKPIALRTMQRIVAQRLDLRCRAAAVGSSRDARASAILSQKPTVTSGDVLGQTSNCLLRVDLLRAGNTRHSAKAGRS